VGQTLAEAVPSWGAIGDRVPVGAPGRWPPPATVPLARGDAESWAAIAGISAGEGFVYTLRDVTANHRLDELRSDIVAIVSHELRTPLSGIVGAAQTLLAHGKSLDAALRDQLLDVIVEQSHRQERVLDEILLAGRLDAEPPSLDDDVFAASDAVAAARDVFAGAPEVAARVLVEDGEDIRVRADRGTTQQVLVNLIENALKYAPPDTPVRVAVRGLDGWARCTVADEGPGIPAHARDHVFEKFFRLDPEQQSGVGGVGLGLYITRELVSRMGGHVGILDSERGSTFFVDLPRGD
jgi:signal transduction histidine kinase